MKELFVYYDPEYDPDCTRKFIAQDVSETIVEFLKSKEFRQLKAQELRDVMLSVIKQEKQTVVIVFAQDVAPDTILDDITATALVRQYLDNGGSIVWMGDIPFFYQARKDGQSRDDKWWQKVAAGNILGVNPVFPTHLLKAEITRAGKRRGLKLGWTGIRPILKNKGIEALAETKSPLSVTYQPLPRPSRWKRLWDRIRGISVGMTGGSIQLDSSPVEAKQGNVLWGGKLANGWFKNFDADNPNSGFLRIWDFRPAAVSKQQLEDLYKVATSTVK